MNLIGKKANTTDMNINATITEIEKDHVIAVDHTGFEFRIHKSRIVVESNLHFIKLKNGSYRIYKI